MSSRDISKYSHVPSEYDLFISSLTHELITFEIDFQDYYYGVGGFYQILDKLLKSSKGKIFAGEMESVEKLPRKLPKFFMDLNMEALFLKLAYTPPRKYFKILLKSKIKKIVFEFQKGFNSKVMIGLSKEDVVGEKKIFFKFFSTPLQLQILKYVKDSFYSIVGYYQFQIHAALGNNAIFQTKKLIKKKVIRRIVAKLDQNKAIGIFDEKTFTAKELVQLF